MQKPSSLKIGSRIVADDQPCYIIAEIGVNHNGDPALARQLVDAAKSAGADAVKFQTFQADALVLSSAPKAEYQEMATGRGSQSEMIASLELPFEEFAALSSYCSEVGIDFISTAFDEASLDYVVGLGPPCLKWPSGEITNVALLRRAADSGLPVILSTGMATIAEIARAVEILSSAGTSMAILQCVSNYPARIEDQNLRAIPALAKSFGCPCGLSDHTIGPYAAVAGRALGMAILEKHITLDCDMEGPDHAASMEPGDFAEMVSAIRAIEIGLGDGVKRVLDRELDVRGVARKSLCYARDLEAGHVLVASDLTAKRPADGLGAEHFDMFPGQKLRRAVARDEYVSPADLDYQGGK